MGYRIRGNMNLFKKYYQLVEKKESINEDIYGNKAIIYHRTNIENLVDKIYIDGFKPGHGALYGVGCYGTYNLESQLKPEMRNKYGKAIIKFMITSTSRFLFLDYDEFIKSPLVKKINTNKKDFIIDQLKYYEFDEIKSLSDLFSSDYTPDFTSDFAKKVYEYYKNSISKIIDGMVFKGRQDFDVILIYNLDLLIPLSYSIDEGKTWNKPNQKNLDYLSKVFSETEKVNVVKNKIYKKLDKDHWIHKAKTSANFELDFQQQRISWIYGTWHDGTWEDGVWRDGTWEKGTWKNGTWVKGIWKDGVFEKGTWHGGTWEGGIWKNGTWKGGTWLGGYDKHGNFHPKGDSPDSWLPKDHWIYTTKISKNSKYKMTNNLFNWENGTWENGTWENGIWHDGTWKNGTWNFGSFLKGTWEFGDWEFGVFGSLHEGIWIDGNFHGGNFFGKLWKNGTWHDGTWSYGTWKKGIWKKGTWKDGTWKDGTWHNGTWEGGDWKGGTWLGGYDKDGEWHPKGDSPNKWNLY
jgi:hypothetical protein